MTVTDNFNRADESPIGGNWTSPIGAVSGAEGALRIVGGQVFTVTDETHCYAVYSGATFSDDQYAQITIRSVDRWTGVILRADTVLDRFYLAFVFAADDYRIQRRWDGAYITLATGASPIWVVGDTMKFEVSGSVHPITLTMYRNGVSVLNYTTTSSAEVRTGGKPGMGIYSPITRSLHLDDWEGGSTYTPGSLITGAPVY